MLRCGVPESCPVFVLAVHSKSRPSLLSGDLLDGLVLPWDRADVPWKCEKSGGLLFEDGLAVEVPCVTV